MLFDINAHTWQMYYVPPNFHKLYREDGTVTIGVTDGNEKAIYINERLQGTLLYKVIAHELTHVAIFEYGVVVDTTTEELIADFVASHGTEIFDVADSILTKQVNKRA